MELFPERSTMRYCPDCKAPNPHNRETCYACGVSLHVTAPNAVSPGEKTFPCTNCTGPIPYSATVCPRCGRVVSAPAAALPTGAAPSLSVTPAIRVVPPEGWVTEPLPDGTIRLSNSQWWKRGPAGLSTGVLMLGMVTFIGIITLLDPRRGLLQDGAVPPLLFLPLILTFCLTAAGCIIMTVLQEEILLRADYLELRYQLGQKVWRQIVEGSAVIRVETTDQRSSRGGRSILRTVYAENLGRKIRLTATNYSRSLLDGLFAAEPAFGNDNAAMFGSYIASVTGWALIDPSAGRF